MTDPRKVFVIYGRNVAAKEAMFTFLSALGLRPIEWEQAVRATGAAAPYIGQILDAAFKEAAAVVAVLTGDDEARLRNQFLSKNDPDYERDLAPQARANVIFETGAALAFHPERTIVVEIGEIRPFSDVLGRHVVHMDGSGEQRNSIANRLSTAGCVVDKTGDRWLSAGDFAAAINASEVSEVIEPEVAKDASAPPIRSQVLSDVEIAILQGLFSWMQKSGANAETLAPSASKEALKEIDFHLKHLEEIGLLDAEHGIISPTLYSLNKEGRAFVIRNNLVP
jgi:hypothetical protein